MDLDWNQNDIPIKKGTPLAVNEHWTVRAKSPGEYLMRFPLKDNNHAAESDGSVLDRVKVTVNGAERAAGGSDDVTLPISVHKYGMPARWIEWVTGIGFLIAFIAGIMRQIFGSE